MGAGFSGLGCARALADAGVEVVVLEARDRIGGRTWTVDMGGAPVDVGGAWVHGERGNPVAELAEELGVALLEHDGEERGFDEQGAAVSAAELAELETLVSDFVAARRSLRETLGEGASVDAAIERFLDERALSQTTRAHAYAALLASVELEYAGPADQTSLDHFHEDLGFGGSCWFPEGGYAALLRQLAEGLDVRTGALVSSITYGEGGVVVESGAGELTGSHLVCTVPLGVMQARVIEFQPALPAEHLAALDRLDMGNLEKVLLRFDSVFWPEDVTDFYLFNERPGEFPQIVNLHYFTGVPVLAAFAGCDESRRLAELDEQTIVDRLMQLLRRSFGDAVPDPVEQRFSAWTSDPLARGSYSYIPVGASHDDLTRVSEPLGGRLLFAGEHTDPEYFGSVHAALLSGRREATRLLNAS